MSRWFRIWVWASALWIWLVVEVQLDLASKSIDPFSRVIRAVRLSTPEWEINWAHWFEGETAIRLCGHRALEMS